MDKLIHTALNSMHSARLKQATSAQDLSNAQVPGFRGDEIGGRFGSIYLYADDQLETRVFSKKSEPGLFSDEQGEMRLTGQQRMWLLKETVISWLRVNLVNWV